MSSSRHPASQTSRIRRSSRSLPGRRRRRGFRFDSSCGVIGPSLRPLHTQPDKQPPFFSNPLKTNNTPREKHLPNTADSTPTPALLASGEGASPALGELTQPHKATGPLPMDMGAARTGNRTAIAQAAGGAALRMNRDTCLKNQTKTPPSPEGFGNLAQSPSPCFRAASLRRAKIAAGSSGAETSSGSG